MPFDLDSFAVDSGALQRRRGVVGGEALVRILLMFGIPKSSISRVSTMAAQANLGTLNTTALFKRLVNAEKMLAELFAHTLSFSTDLEEKFQGHCLVAVDATALSGPAAKGTNQRLHTVYDLCKGIPRSVQITDHHGGETLVRHTAFGAGDLLLCDAGYGYNRSFLWALNSKAHILMRFNFETVKLYDEDGNRIWAHEVNQIVPEEDPLELLVYLPEWDHALRAVGSRNDQGVPVWLLTDLSEEDLPAREVRQLYR